jgi:peptide deformylase
MAFGRSPVEGKKDRVVLPIMQAGDPVLRQKARALSVPEILTPEIQRLIAAMRDTLYEAPGVGLAAPQIGISLQLAVIEDREEYQADVPADQLAERERRPVPFQVIINPAIVPASKKIVEFAEGCLSLAGFVALVPRAHAVRVECLDERGEPRVIAASGWYARILQHEIDHLQGALYIDRMRSRSFASVENWSKHWKGKPTAEVRSALKI